MWINVALLLVTTGASAYDQSPKSTAQVSKDIFAVDRGHVLELSYRSLTIKMIAYRWQVHDKFVVYFARKDGSRPEICTADKGFETILRRFTVLKLLRPIDDKTVEEYQKTYPLNTWAELVIRDDSEIDPFRAMISPVKESTTETLIRVEHTTYVAEIERRVFDLISGGCRSVGH